MLILGESMQDVHIKSDALDKEKHNNTFEGFRYIIYPHFTAVINTSIISIEITKKMKYYIY